MLVVVVPVCTNVSCWPFVRKTDALRAQHTLFANQVFAIGTLLIPEFLSWWTETELRTDSLHQSAAPLGLTWSFCEFTCAHTAWKSTSAPPVFCTSGKETVENLKISPGQLAPCQQKRIKRQRTVPSAGCKVLVPNAGFLLASMSSLCRFRPIECSYSLSVSVFVPQDIIRGSAIVQLRLSVPRSSFLHYRVLYRTGNPWHQTSDAKVRIARN